MHGTELRGGPTEGGAPLLQLYGAKGRAGYPSAEEGGGHEAAAVQCQTCRGAQSGQLLSRGRLAEGRDICRGVCIKVGRRKLGVRSG